MGKKVSPYSFRLGITQTWKSKWYDRRSYKKNLLQDLKIRKFVREYLYSAGIADVIIERRSGVIELNIKAAKPGIIVGRGGDKVGELQITLKNKFDDNFAIRVQEVRSPESNADLVAQNIAEQITKRFPYRRVCKMAIERAKNTKIKGIKIRVAGRLNGVDIARQETYTHGTVPLHTLRAKIDYATAESPTTYGIIGVKVWIYHGLVFKGAEGTDL